MWSTIIQPPFAELQLVQDSAIVMRKIPKKLVVETSPGYIAKDWHNLNNKSKIKV